MKRHYCAGGYEENDLYGRYDPPIIRAVAFLSVIFAALQFYLHFISRPLVRFLYEYQKFRCVQSFWLPQ